MKKVTEANNHESNDNKINLTDELNKIKIEIDLLANYHKNNERVQTLKSECLQVIDAILQGKHTDRFLLKISKHGGKMKGINSLSTYKLFSQTCLNLKDNPKTICNKCYVDKAFMRYPQLSLALIYNTLIMKYTSLNDRQLPIINDLYFRFEAFSDLQNLNHLENLYKIAKHNPDTRFALWTKNISLLLKAKAPKNVNLILSSPILNECLPMSEKIISAIKDKTGSKNVKVFTVYDEEHIGSVGQNCMKQCISCLKCYKAKDKETHIHELLK